jgi:hypothetical protein
MTIKVHICRTAREAEEAIQYWGETKLIQIGAQPTRDAQIFEGPEAERPKLDYLGKDRFVLIFNV